MLRRGGADAQTGTRTPWEITTMQWGLIPNWHPKDKVARDFKPSTFNARIEGCHNFDMIRVIHQFLHFVKLP